MLNGVSPCSTLLPAILSVAPITAAIHLLARINRRGCLAPCDLAEHNGEDPRLQGNITLVKAALFSVHFKYLPHCGHKLFKFGFIDLSGYKLFKGLCKFFFMWPVRYGASELGISLSGTASEELLR